MKLDSSCWTKKKPSSTCFVSVDQRKRRKTRVREVTSNRKRSDEELKFRMTPPAMRRYFRLSLIDLISAGII